VGLEIDADALASFAQRHGIHRLSAFGSVLRTDFDADSDVDLLVEFDADRVPGLLGIASMELELSAIFGRDVELRTYGDLSRYFRDQVRGSAVALYAA